MGLIFLGAKVGLAVVLLVAGGAKLADLPGFTAAVALAVAMTELVLGGASLAAPSAGWLNLAVLALGCGFLAVSAAGYALHRSCRCFGALSQRRFNAAAVARGALIAAVAVAAAQPPRAASVQLGLTARLLLLGCAAILAVAACTAARAIAVARDAQLGWSS